jgi:hypothetical protein
MPFLALLRIDVKLKLADMLPICAWAWLMHFVDLEFQIMPSLQAEGVFPFYVSVRHPRPAGGCGLPDVYRRIARENFCASLNRHPVYPLKDPRMAEALEVYVPPAGALSIVPGTRQ